ncbi:MAG: AraC family transcriptional regulator [Carboxylicivirga sp.]|jgi:AraC-like DNA-binding protein|nr:AraC family transcriptional regulator [Carboxylicivirga sp.]
MEKYTEYKVSAKSKRFINLIWTFEKDENDHKIQDRLILPNGCFNIAILIGNGGEARTKRGYYDCEPGIFLTSQMTEVSTVRLKPGAKLIFIQMTAWTLSLFPDLDLNDFTDVVREVDPADLPFKKELSFSDFENIQFVIHLVNRFFSQLSAKHPQVELIEKVCRRIIDKHEEDIKLTDLARDYDISPRMLQLKFKKQTGFTLKGYLKVIKFRRTLKEILENKEAKMTESTHKKGYFDQSHLYKTFQSIAKTSPRKIEQHPFVLPERH